MVEMVLLQRTYEEAGALESLGSASKGLGPGHRTWWGTSAPTTVLGSTLPVRGLEDLKATKKLLDKLRS